MLLGPLDTRHRALGATMGAFAGWDMPIAYPAGTIAEHAAVRGAAGLFDVSHLGKVVVTGPDHLAFLDGQLSNRMVDLKPGRARYSLILNDEAGIIDDLIVYRHADHAALVVPNASNVDEVAARLAAAAPDSLSVERVMWTTLAVQGPRSQQIIEALYPSAKGLPYMGVAVDGDVVIARSGYTGEWGYEVFTTEADAAATWDRLLAAVTEVGGAPCGLGARDVLRLEMGYPLHGNDISTETNPLDAGLGWAVKLDDRSFPGADALRNTSAARALRGIRLTGRGVPRHGHAVLREGVTIGECTSGGFSPTLKTGIAMAYLPLDTADGDEVEIDIRGKTASGVITTPPFVDASPRRATP
jgi:aminomethyltransferase